MKFDKKIKAFGLLGKYKQIMFGMNKKHVWCYEINIIFVSVELEILIL
nr:MAG TPA: hypothetical protein [Caudoviricetes sp.]